VVKVRAMTFTEKERLVDELFREQPHVLASFLVQQTFGVSLVKMDFLLDIVLICFQAMVVGCIARSAAGTDQVAGSPGASCTKRRCSCAERGWASPAGGHELD
jgi:hypothetical protein